MQIGPTRDQITRCLQRITLPFVRGETVLRGDLNKAIDELKGLAEFLPTEHPKPVEPVVSTPLVEKPAEPPLPADPAPVKEVHEVFPAQSLSDKP